MQHANDDAATQAAADALLEYLFGPQWSWQTSAFCGVAGDDIVVYTTTPEDEWRLEKPELWRGHKVRWRFGVGKAEAL